MIRITLYKNMNENNDKAYGKYYPRPVIEETVDLDALAEHMAKHNTPFSAGAIKGILTDAVSCTRELILDGKNVKFPDLAIFSAGIICNGGAESEAEFTVAKYVKGVRLRARGTGKLTSAKLGIEATVKRISTGMAGTIVVPGGDSGSTGKDDSGSGTTSGGGSTSGGSTTGGGGNTNPGGSDTDGEDTEI